jgi:peptidyl-prolyl cis-trans isomerase SurA
MFKYILLFSFFISFNSHGVLVDKIAGVINDKVFTLSEIKRIKATIAIRKEIAPFIYKSSKLREADILILFQRRFIIKDRLAELGFVISDDAVESRIKETEKGLRLNRDELLKFLSSKGITFNEYFELIREAMEYTVFQRRIIGPLVTITDQELKSYYYKINSSNKALKFTYNVLDFSIDQSLVPTQDLQRLPKILDNYKKTGNIPKIYSDIDTDDLGLLLDEDLPAELSKILKETSEKSFSELYIKNGVIHSFYITKKELAESSDFLKKKNLIYNQIFIERSDKISENWFNRETLNYYVLNNLLFM